MNTFYKALATVLGFPWSLSLVQGFYQVLLILAWQYRAASSWVMFAFILLVVSWIVVRVLAIFGVRIVATPPAGPPAGPRPEEYNPDPPSTL